MEWLRRLQTEIRIEGEQTRLEIVSDEMLKKKSVRNNCHWKVTLLK
ncbi:MAG: hypothetical protein CM1200mP28_03740 [Deltaproteobacteria bacterium]|nr:MAG: hypothetical protein CM1200mP28_03740 [Deltaproteobacteria bacterium]